MRIGIIDADLLGKRKHRFPNLACMKLSGYHKRCGHDVELCLSYENLDCYDKVFISKVFTNTPCPESALSKSNVVFGGTGFFYDQAPPLPTEIEHSFPDYHLYDTYVEQAIAAGVKAKSLSYYTDYSIGFLTRGCFRKCVFCVNKNYNTAILHSVISEFYDPARPKICLLDDNFFACSDWRELLKELQATGVPFQFKQGLDERLLTPEKCELLFKSKYDGAYIFAFDNIADKDVIIEKLKLIRRYTLSVPVFYVLCGFDRTDKYDATFWRQDIKDLLARLYILGSFGCLPYIMRFERYIESPYKKVYIDLARWCNQFSFFKKMPFIEFCYRSGNGYYSNLMTFLQGYPELAVYLNKVLFKKAMYLEENNDAEIL